MTQVLGWIFLCLLLVTSYFVVTRVLREPCLLTRLIATPAVAVALLLFGQAYLWRVLPLGASYLALAVLLLGLLVWAIKEGATPNPYTFKLSRSSLLYLLLGSGLVVFYALFGQSTSMVVDGDLFIHISSIGLFTEGHYPPHNPFLQLPTHGHFGRQMLIAGLAFLSGFPFLEVEWVYTTAAQLCSFCLLFCLIWRLAGSQWQACLGSGFAFWGANLGSSIGIADTTANHNPTATLFWVLSSWLLFRLFTFTDEASKGQLMMATILSAALIGTDAIVYEIHWALMMLALPFLFWGLKADGQLVQRGLGLLVVSVLTAASIGGPITQMASGLVPSKSKPSVESASQQKVRMRVPKEKLFQIRLDNLRPSRPFEGKWRPWRAEFAASNDYSSVFSKRVLNVFWYPNWLFPLVFVFLFWKRHAVGIWFATLALGAILTPAVVDFGFFEGESLRWLFFFGVCSSLSFGLAVGNLIDKWTSKSARGTLLILSLAVGIVGLHLSLRDAVNALKNPGQSLPIGRPGIVPGTGLVPRPFALMNAHLRVTEGEVAAARWIRENSPKEARVLIDDLQVPVNARAAWIGLTGRFPAGYVAPKGNTSNPQEYLREPSLESFWRTGDWNLVRQLEFGILVLHPGRHPQALLAKIESSDSLKKVYENESVLVFDRTD